MLHRADFPLLSQGSGRSGGHLPTFRAPRRRQRPGATGNPPVPPPLDCRCRDAGDARCLGSRRHGSVVGTEHRARTAPVRGAFSQPYCHPCRGAGSRLPRRRSACRLALSATRSAVHLAGVCSAGFWGLRPTALLQVFATSGATASSLPRWLSPSPQAKSPRTEASALPQAAAERPGGTWRL